jgi:hypothetical protein
VSSYRRSGDRGAFTLLEMLVATAASVVLLGIVMELFAVLSDAVNNDRSVAQLDAQMRSVRSSLITDLDGFTVTPQRSLNDVWLQAMSADVGNGYFEYIEGPNTDTLQYEDQANEYTAYGPFNKATANPAGAGPTDDSDDRIVGDTDDVLMFTTQAYGDPFVGQCNGQQIDSDYAEVAWFCLPTPGTYNPVTYTLYRRQLLVMGYVSIDPFASGNQSIVYSDWASYFNAYDVSCRRELSGGVYKLFVNSLQDLARRENRFLHDTGDASVAGGKINRALLRSPPGNAAPTYPYYSRVGRSLRESTFDAATSSRGGDDVMMTNVIAFDVRAFDPRLVVKQVGIGVQLTPSDPGYWTMGGSWRVASGPADLYYQRTQGTPDSSLHPSSLCYALGKNALLRRKDGNGLVDDLFDTCPWDSGDGGPQDSPHDQINGLQITLRTYDPKTKRVRQLTFTWTPS